MLHSPLEDFPVFDSDDSEIVKDLLSVYPEEGCGLLINKKGKLVWKFCTNIADDPEEDFVIDPKEYIEASLVGTIHSIIHSHVDSSCEPSSGDKKASCFLQIPYTIYSLRDEEKYTFTPPKINNPLLGRDYEFGSQDCYSLVRDYYKENFNLILPKTVFQDNWWDEGLNYFDDLFDAFGFEEVDTPKIGDGIIFKVFSHVPNHCGVYVGEDNFIHHAIDRLSCKESLHSGWGKHIHRIVRCKQFI
jgi:proteasome lid subunit RPN8/RPN11